jgi:hypothetical protein
MREMMLQDVWHSHTLSRWRKIFTVARDQQPMTALRRGTNDGIWQLDPG